MKVAFLSFGFGEYCFRLTGALSNVAEVMLLLPETCNDAHSNLLNPAVDFRTFALPRLRQPWRQLRMLRKLRREIKQFQPDVLHVQVGHPWFNLALPFLGRVPLVMTIHDPRHHVGDRDSQKCPQAIMDYGCRRANRVIVHGVRMKETIMSLLNLRGERIDVVPHVSVGDGQAHADLAEDEHSILFFGRIWEYKGLEYLIRAEPSITARVPKARIVIAGEGESLTRYHKMMVHPEHFQVYNTHIPVDQQNVLFRQASVVVLPYIDASQSGVIPVAYTFAKPVVATTVGGLPEMVDDGCTGYLVPPRDSDALADAVVHLLQHPTLRHALGGECQTKSGDRMGTGCHCRANPAGLPPGGGCDLACGSTGRRVACLAYIELTCTGSIEVALGLSFSLHT